MNPTSITNNCLNIHVHRITSKIYIEWQNGQKPVWFLRHWKNFDVIYAKVVVFVSFEDLWWYFWDVSTKLNISKNSIWKSRYWIEPKKLTSCSTTSNIFIAIIVAISMPQNVVMPQKSVDIFNFRVQCGFGDDSYKYCSNFPFNSSKYAHTTFIS